MASHINVPSENRDIDARNGEPPDLLKDPPDTPHIECFSEFSSFSGHFADIQTLWNQ
jgi:hypothetical protein